MQRIDWSQGRWTHEPVRAVPDADALVVQAVEASDAWRTTSYGFVHDTEHALLRPFPTGTAVEVAFVCELTEQFDQAGVFVRVDDETWVKAGVELSDGLPQLGAVVTHRFSDWSVAPVPQWQGRVVTVRVSRAGDALTVRARVDDEPFRMVRVAYLPPDAAAEAGPLICAPSRAGFTVRFVSWAVGDADVSLH